MGALITKSEFLKAYNAYPPNKWCKFTFRFFSASTKKEDKWVSRIFTATVSTLFLLSFIGTVLGLSSNFVGTFIVIFTVLIAAIGILMFAAKFMNNWRIRKIRKALGGISRYEYDILELTYLE